MVRPNRAPAALSIVASALGALGVMAAGVQIGQGELGGDPRQPTVPMLTRPAARVAVPPALQLEPSLAEQFLTIASAAPRPNILPVSAPGPQSVPAPGPSDPAPAPAPSPSPAPTPPDPVVPAPDLTSPVPTPDPGLVDPVITLVDDLLTPEEEAGAEAPTSPITDLLGL